MNHLIAKIKARKAEFLKVVSDERGIFDMPDLSDSQAYSPSYKLEDGEWYNLDQFLSRGYENSLIGSTFNSTDYNQITKQQYSKINYLCSKQGDFFLFQKMSSTRLLYKKWFYISGAPQLEIDKPIIILNSFVDAVYDINGDSLYFKNIARVKSMFRGIEELYREATQVEVDALDTAFQNPTKPIGSFYDLETSNKLAKEKGYDMVEDAGRGYRRVVPSPKPINVVEIEIIKTLVNAGHLVITVGGGGIPVVKKGNEFIGVPAVIDKDFASAKIADLLDADKLIILTAVDKVKINYNKPNEESLDDITISEIDAYIEEGHFLKGSMLPKIEAAKLFVQAKDGRIAIIAALEEAGEAINGKAGTIIRN